MERVIYINNYDAWTHAISTISQWWTVTNQKCLLIPKSFDVRNKF